MTYTITLSNGRVLTGLTLNGTVFRYGGHVEREDLAGGLRRVVITRAGEPDAEAVNLEADMSGEYECMTLGYYKSGEGFTEFQLNARDERSVEMLRLRADVDYMAMLSGVEL